MMVYYTQKELRELFPDVKPRTIQSWAEKGLVKTASTKEGSGGKRLYNRDAILAVGLIRLLSKHWVPLFVAEELMRGRNLHTLGYGDLGGLIIWVTDTGDVVCGKDLPDDQDFCWVIFWAAERDRIGHAMCDWARDERGYVFTRGGE
jgi:hypothetical protein